MNENSTFDKFNLNAQELLFQIIDNDLEIIRYQTIGHASSAMMIN